MFFWIQTFLFKEIHFKMSSVKWHPFCLGLDVLKDEIPFSPISNKTAAITSSNILATQWYGNYKILGSFANGYAVQSGELPCLPDVLHFSLIVISQDRTIENTPEPQRIWAMATSFLLTRNVRSIRMTLHNKTGGRLSSRWFLLPYSILAFLNYRAKSEVPFCTSFDFFL